MLKVFSAAYNVNGVSKVAVLGADTVTGKKFTFLSGNTLLKNKLEEMKVTYPDRSYNDANELPFYTQVLKSFESGKEVSNVRLLQQRYNTAELQTLICSGGLQAPVKQQQPVQPQPTFTEKMDSVTEFVKAVHTVGKAVANAAAKAEKTSDSSSSSSAAPKTGSKVSVRLDKESFNAVFSVADCSFSLGRDSEGRLELEVVKESPISLTILAMVKRSVGLQ